MSNDAATKTAFLLTMKLKPVPREAYLAKGAEENAYAQQLISEGVISSFFVSADHRDYWIGFNVASEEELLKTLQAFPFYPYFDYSYRPVIDMVASVQAGMTDPNLGD